MDVRAPPGASVYVTVVDDVPYFLTVWSKLAVLVGAGKRGRLPRPPGTVFWTADAQRWAESCLHREEKRAHGAKDQEPARPSEALPPASDEVPASLSRLRLRLAALRQLLLSGDDEKLLSIAADPNEVSRLARLLSEADLAITGRSVQGQPYMRVARAVILARRQVLRLSDDGYSSLVLGIDDPDLVRLR